MITTIFLGLLSYVIALMLGFTEISALALSLVVTITAVGAAITSRINTLVKGTDVVITAILMLDSHLHLMFLHDEELDEEHETSS